MNVFAKVGHGQSKEGIKVIGLGNLRITLLDVADVQGWVVVYKEVIILLNHVGEIYTLG